MTNLLRALTRDSILMCTRLNDVVTDLAKNIKQSNQTSATVKQLAIDFKDHNEKVDTSFDQMSANLQGKIDQDVSIVNATKHKTDKPTADISCDVQHVCIDIDQSGEE